MQITCVSGTYNRLQSLKRMVESVRADIQGFRYEIVLVDGGSNDGTIEWAREQKDVVLIEHGALLGSAKAFEDGFKAARGEFAVTLNDDITVERGSIPTAFDILSRQPDVGQVAFGHRYQARGGDKTKAIVGRVFGNYPYAQCGMTRRVLLEVIGWCGVEVEGYRQYAWDPYISCRIWELGWRVVEGPGCAVVDYEVDDELRKSNNIGPRKETAGDHPDAIKFRGNWEHRLRQSNNWIGNTMSYNLGSRIVWKAKHGVLRTMRFKGMMRAQDPMRVGMINEFSKFGVAKQVNQLEAWNKYRAEGFQQWAIGEIKAFKPDLLILQVQHENSLTGASIRQIRGEMPETFIVNWDGDTHPNITEFYYDIARSCHLQLTVSPTTFPFYVQNGAPNVGYWPIGVEDEFINAGKAAAEARGSLDNSGASKLNYMHDVCFLGVLYGIDGPVKFPEAVMRREVVVALAKDAAGKGGSGEGGYNFGLYGYGWNAVGLQNNNTMEQFDKNAEIYVRSKMALSISQTKDLWGYSSDRLYNICACGCPALIQRFAGMEEHGFVDGETCIAWTTVQECIEKVRYYLDGRRNAKRIAIGEAGRQLVLNRHNWRHRVREFFLLLGGLDY